MRPATPARTLICAACLLPLGWPQASAGWTAGNSHTVNPLTNRSFEVLGESGSANVDFWCAAGDYARRVLDVPISQSIFIVRGRASAQTAVRKSAVQFSLDPPAGDVKPGWPLLLSVTRVGETQSAVAAWTYCLSIKGDEP